jgi:AraC-like DNA-binding protein
MTGSSSFVTPGISTARATLTVSAGMARGLIDFAAEQGTDRSALLERAGLDHHAIADDDARIPFSRYAALYCAAEELCADPAFSLHFGEWVTGMDLVVCHVGSASPTLGAAIEAINQYNRLAIDLETIDGGTPYQFERTREGIWLIDASIYPDGVSQVTETSFARLVVGTRLISDRQFVRALHFVRRAPAHRDEYERVFGAPVLFGQRQNAMLVDPEWFGLPLPSTSSYADSVLTTHAERLMGDLEVAGRRRRLVADVVAARLASGKLSMTAVARDLGMSRAALYRALRSEGTTFEQIVDRARVATATRLLESGVSIKETAGRLGYSDRSAFSRAFKRWTGVSPGTVNSC